MLLLSVLCSRNSDIRKARYVSAFETLYGKKQTCFYFQVQSLRDGMYSKFPLLFRLLLLV